MIYLDTHVVVWLYEGLTEKLSPAVQRAIDENELFVSGMVLLELKFLYEIKKITNTPSKIITDLEKSIELQLCDIPLRDIVEKATNLTWTRDPFDRVIVANAAFHKHPLITKDAVIHKNYQLSVW